MGVESGRGRRAMVAMMVAIACVVVVGCGSDSSDGAGGSGGRADMSLYADVPSEGCGSLPTAPAPDPDGVVAQLPEEQRAAYKSISIPTVKSAWSDFKPDHGPPYTVGLNLIPPINDVLTQINTTLENSLKESPNVGKVMTKTAQSANDVVGQLANFDALLREKPDIIVTVAIQPVPFAAAVDRAAKQGVPVVSFLNPVPSKNSVNINFNNYEAVAQSTATIMRLIEGKGNTFFVSGIPGDIATDLGLKAYRATVKLCPGVKDLGQIFGIYTNSSAKRETLSFLATHPQKIAAVSQAASMAPGIMQAFQQSGRPIPTILDAAGQKGSLGYWRQHPDYRGIGFGVPSAPTARTVSNVTLRVLEGQGPKLNNIMNLAATITPENLDQWAEPGWTLATQGAANGPDRDLMSDDYLDPLFNQGAPPK